MSEKNKAICASIGFISSLTALCTIIIPFLSTILAIGGVFFSIFGKGRTHIGMTFSSIGMGLIAFFIDMVYLYFSL